MGNYGFLLRDDDVKVSSMSFYGHGCYSSLGYTRPETREKTVALCIYLHNQDKFSATAASWERYIRYLLKSPLRHAFYSTNARKVMKDRVICVRPDVNAVYMMCAMIAVRYTNEYPRVPFTWDLFVRAGMQPDIAFYAAHAVCFSDRPNKGGIFSKEKDKEAERIGSFNYRTKEGGLMGSSHGLFSNIYVNATKNFLRKDSSLLEDPFKNPWKDAPSYMGIHALMGGTVGDNFATEIGTLANKHLPVVPLFGWNGAIVDYNPVFSRKHVKPFIDAVNTYYTKLTGIEYVKA